MRCRAEMAIFATTGTMRPPNGTLQTNEPALSPLSGKCPPPPINTQHMRKDFNPQDIDSFCFDGFSFESPTSTARLRYSFDNGQQFEETIQFPPPSKPLSSEQQHALDQALHLLHLFAGISYYKAAIPPTIRFTGQPPERTTATLVETLYRHGLGEFAYRNDIHLHDRIQFTATGSRASTAVELPESNGILVPVGGGKDSIVSIEALKTAHEPVTLFSVGRAEPIRRTAEHSGLRWLSAKRQLSPALFDLNARGALNGHVPVTAIVSMIAVCTAILHGQRAVVLSNERSANEGNLALADGFVVNHQYSKGLDFELALAQHIHSHIATNIDYFSLLRPWSELAIAQQFSKHKQYHSVFTSCNTNFVINRETPSSRWCLDCPKCRFVFLALAPFIEKKRMINIFGINLLDERQQRPGYDALLGIDAHKPFECVGEEAECAAAFILISKNPEWKNDFMVRYFRDEVLPGIEIPEALTEKYLASSSEHNIPEKYLEMVRANFGA